MGFHRNQMALRPLLFGALVVLAVVNCEEPDFIDTHVEDNPDTALKCDACTIIAALFSDALGQGHSILSRVKKLSEPEVIEALEGVCDDSWEGYGIKIVDGVERLSGPGSEVETSEGEVEYDSLWDHRLQDMCDELLSEAPDEMTLYKTWLSDSEGLSKYLCRGEGFFGACTSEDWGPWPGDNYEDYDDYDDHSDYFHDEF
ncbi:marginal zone B- and B1-cell-specific protein-like isoform X3 [Oratosquilla oratoria]|uniref:marginal zone B- and B1-cell-specific protein-like isoform X3 n=1 Tax=Oratosquilla oratoria TaxID=337810 RepID=UPI003F76F81C